MRRSRSAALGAACAAVVAGGLLAACASPSAPVPARTSTSAASPSSATPSGTAASQAELSAAVASPDGAGPLVAVTRQGGGTVVTTIDRTARTVLDRTRLDGAWALPEPVAGGGQEGITPSATAVVLVADPAPTATAVRPRFAVVTPGRAATPRVVDLPGGFGYDAVSPDGGRLFLVESLPPKGSEHYQVRSYDVAAGRLDDGVVVDKTHIDEWMAGHPVGRVTSPDGTVVATMYDRTGGDPFVHVLHTADVFALCVDLPPAARGLRLVPAPSSTGAASPLLHLVDPAGAVRFTVDPGSGEVGRPGGA